jgi:hypothetical protein
MAMKPTQATRKRRRKGSERVVETLFGSSAVRRRRQLSPRHGRRTSASGDAGAAGARPWRFPRWSRPRLARCRECACPGAACRAAKSRAGLEPRGQGACDRRRRPARRRCRAEACRMRDRRRSGCWRQGLGRSRPLSRRLLPGHFVAAALLRVSRNGPKRRHHRHPSSEIAASVPIGPGMALERVQVERTAPASRTLGFAHLEVGVTNPAGTCTRQGRTGNSPLNRRHRAPSGSQR